jgi:hypothetical protein
MRSEDYNVLPLVRENADLVVVSSPHNKLFVVYAEKARSLNLGCSDLIT